MIYLLNFKELDGQRKPSLAKKIKAYDFLTPKAIPKSLNSRLQEVGC